jgi:hypothetical protein
MEAFAKSDDERDFYLDRVEGYILYIDLDKVQEDIENLEKELAADSARYASIPKMTFYETKKIMEGFVNEKVYDIDTKEKLLEIIQAKEAREHFLEFLYDHHSELEKWQQFYQERSRIRIIEWLRQNNFEFVFEEDLDLPRDIMEKVKVQLFDSKASKDVLTARKTLITKAKTYYSSEALNPRPKRGRPPKLIIKNEAEPQMTTDLYITPTKVVRGFLFMPEFGQGTFALFSQKFENEDQLLARKKNPLPGENGFNLESLNQKLLAIRNLTNRWEEEERAVTSKTPPAKKPLGKLDDDFFEEEDEEDEEIEVDSAPKLNQKLNHKQVPQKTIPKPAAKIAQAQPQAVKKPASKIAPQPKAKAPPLPPKKPAPKRLKPKPKPQIKKVHAPLPLKKIPPKKIIRGPAPVKKPIGKAPPPKKKK